jgi:hypothetical protein
MGDVGFKVSRKGYNVGTCSDRELMYSSSWPGLKVYDSGSVTINDTGAQTLASHGLGYYPAYLILVDGELRNDGAEIAFPGINQHIVITDSVLKWTAANGTWGSSIDAYYIIFVDDLETDFTSEIVSSTDTSAGESADFGVKAVIEGQNVHSDDYRNYSIHSGLRASTVHMVESGSAVGVGTLTVTHNLGYEPVFWVYGKLGGSDGYQVFGNAGDCTIEVTTTKVDITTALGAAWDYSVLILKDNVLVA